MKDTYFDTNNGLLTRSKILDYVKSPEYFKKKHIDGTVENESTDSLIIGAAVDALLTRDMSGRKYQVARDELGKPLRRMPKLVAEYEERGITLITESQEEEINGLVEAVGKTSVWKMAEKYGTFQETIKLPLHGSEHFKWLAGRPDVYWIDGDTLYLLDLKTTTTVNHRKYYYKVLDYKYEWQMALYGSILKTLNPTVKSVKYLHLAVEKVKDIYNVELFLFPQAMIDAALPMVMGVVKQILDDKEFKKYDPDWNSPVVLGDFNQIPNEEE